MLNWAKQILKLKFNLSSNHFRNYSKDESFNKISASYWHKPGGFTFSNATLGDVVDTAADKYGDDVAISVPFQNVNKTFTQFKQEIDQLAASFIGLGLQKNDRIAIWSPNNYEWLLTQFAASKAGLILVCLNPSYRAAELEYSLNKVQCKAIITAERFKILNFYNILSEVVPEISSSKPGQLCSQKVRSLQYVITLADKALPGTYSFKEIFKNDGSENTKLLHERQKTIQFDNATAIMFTSGTTGNPKAAALSHFQLVNEAISAGRKIGFVNEKPTICLQVPLFHIFAYALGPLVTVNFGGKCVIPSEFFHSPSSLECIQNEKCTVVYGVPTMFFDMLKHISESNYNLKSWKQAVLGAAPIPDFLVHELKSKLGVNIANGYGITETSSGICLALYPAERHSGRPIEHVEVKIIDNNGNIVPFNTKGEILCRTPYAFLGYWEDKEKTDEVLDSSRWYHTGDVGSMDEEGNICVTGRIKDLIIRGGENIYPQEIENLLLTHPAVFEVYVVGVPDIRMGEEICACIQLKPNQKITENDVKEYCKDKISHFKIPKHIVFLEGFPKTESGKIQKYKLREQCTDLLKL
ncbi:medium-chain acyl-CoA ligase ACSF2, mitochondrial-like [Centruroides vittatus]|uniref:medium-chain acyl-CoA ligase ACSF2, mitochondrial-like n=1 Tax=Centruroides vittatus TaxID=120091 RepID=UPI00350E9C48